MMLQNGIEGLNEAFLCRLDFILPVALHIIKKN